MNSDDYDQSGSYSHSENYGPFSFHYDTAPRTVHNIPDPRRPEKAIEDRQYAQYLLSIIVSIFKYHRVGLSPTQREETERLERAFMLRRFDDIPPEIIAKLLKFSISTVYRDVAVMTKWVHDWAILIIELKDQIKNKGDKISEKVLDDLLEGKSIEEIKRNSKLTPKVIEEALVKLYTLSRAIQKEIDEKPKKNAETDNGGDGQYPTDETIN